MMLREIISIYYENYNEHTWNKRCRNNQYFCDNCKKKIGFLWESREALKYILEQKSVFLWES